MFKIVEMAKNMIKGGEDQSYNQFEESNTSNHPHYQIDKSNEQNNAFRWSIEKSKSYMLVGPPFLA